MQAMPGRETPNEDSAAVLTTPVGFVLAVADGMGGGPDGDRASAEAISALAERLATPGEGVRGQILDAFEDANQRVLRLGGGAATTLSVVEIEWEGGVVRARK